MKTNLLCVAAACVLALNVGTANADTYFLSGQSVSPDFPGILSGWIEGPTSFNNQQWRFGAEIDFTLPPLPPNYYWLGFGTTSGGWSNGVLPGGAWDFESASGSSFFSMRVIGELFSGGEFTGTFSPHIARCIGSDCSEWYAPISVSGILTDITPAVPLPTSLPLFATGLGALGLLGWRRKRKGAD